MFGLLNAMISKAVSEIIFFQSNNFTACKIKDEKEVANSVMMFNLLKIIHPFQGEEAVKDLVRLKLELTRIFNWLLIGLNTNSSL